MPSKEVPAKNQLPMAEPEAISATYKTRGGAVKQSSGQYAMGPPVLDKRYRGKLLDKVWPYDACMKEDYAGSFFEKIDCADF